MEFEKLLEVVTCTIEKFKLDLLNEQSSIAHSKLEPDSGETTFHPAISGVSGSVVSIVVPIHFLSPPAGLASVSMLIQGTRYGRNTISITPLSNHVAVWKLLLNAS